SMDSTVADVIVRAADLVTLPARPTVGDVARVVGETGYSRFPGLAGGAGYAGYLHVKDILDLIDDPTAAVPAERVRGLPTVAADARLDVALSVLRRARAHRAG